MSKLDHKSLKCIFLDYSRFHKRYRCYCPNLRRYLVSTDVTFLENVPFSSPTTQSSQGEEDNLLVYTLASPIVSPKHAHVPAQVKPSITQVYSRLQNPPASSPPPPALSSDPINCDDLPIAFRKGKRQCAHPISSFCSYNHFSSHSCFFVASLDSISLPNNFHEALSHPSWHSAMIEEMDSFNGNGT